jgi:hypothetical protein
MTNFNSSRKELSMAQQTLNSMKNQLPTVSKISPDYIMLLRAIENLEYSMHKERITQPLIKTVSNLNDGASMTKLVSATNNGVSMIKPVFSDDLTLRQLEYKDCLVMNEAFTQEEVKTMTMRELRIAIDVMFPTVITVRTGCASGGVSTHYVTKKAA